MWIGKDNKNKYSSEIPGPELIAGVSGKGLLSDEIRPGTWPLRKRHLYLRYVNIIHHTHTLNFFKKPLF